MKQNSYYLRKCFNCETEETPLWRKTSEGLVMCNACGLYYRNHYGALRPKIKNTLKPRDSNTILKLELIALQSLIWLKNKETEQNKFNFKSSKTETEIEIKNKNKNPLSETEIKYVNKNKSFNEKYSDGMKDNQIKYLNVENPKIHDSYIINGSNNLKDNQIKIQNEKEDPKVHDSYIMNDLKYYKFIQQNKKINNTDNINNGNVEDNTFKNMNYQQNDFYNQTNNYEIKCYLQDNNTCVVYQNFSKNEITEEEYIGEINNKYRNITNY